AVSTPERGSQFAVEGPMSAAAPARAPLRDVGQVDRGQLSGIRVLCIDNEPSILDGMETLLGGWGCRVVKAVDLKSALAALADSKIVPDALLVDYHIGEGNGIEVITQLRRRFADAMAILITADRDAGVREQAHALDPGAQQADQTGCAAGPARTMPLPTRGSGRVKKRDK